MKRRIGSGAFGVVYEAFDGLRSSTVAIKALRHATSDALLRFKREFRSLSDITHRNLVQLHELIADGEEWLVTMELIRGKTFVEHVWSEGPYKFFASADDPTETDTDRHEPERLAEGERYIPEATPANLERLSEALPQLVQGVMALHAAGKLHRDIKPSNVLVTSEPRVVLLDFGLVTDSGSERTFDSLRIAGTPAYMSPEQGAGLPLTPASDWYSIGVMLYEVLTGGLPFIGPYLQVLTDKQKSEPPPPSALIPDIPPVLDDLCRDLLRRDPLARPIGEQILQRLSGSVVTATVSGAPRATAAPFVGRQRHLRALRDAFEASLNGAQTTVCVAGPSGIGKTSLLRTFLDHLRGEFPDAILLTGRCYQRESVPYKGVDSLIDSVHRVLAHYAPLELEALLPRDILAAEQLFPVLSDLGDAVRARRRVAVVPPDQQELRRRAFGAMRDLFQRLADRAPLVLAIDDLQWGDIDSAELLKEILRPPDAPALLFIASYRAEEVRSSPFLRAFLDDRVTMRELHVGHLSSDESRQLVDELLQSVPNTTSDVANLIAYESGGNPFFIDELVRSLMLADEAAVREAARRGAHDSDAREINIRDLLRLRLARLDEESRGVLQLVAVHHRPLASAVLRRAVGDIDVDRTIARLRGEHLVRTREAAQGEEVEIYHDRLADAVLTLIDDDEQRRLHAALAAALESVEDADDEILGDHLLAAGVQDRGTTYIIRAADKAAKALAFDRAARLYRRALSIDPTPADTVRRKLGDVLASAGRGAEAAAEYLAVKGVNRADELELKRRAAQQLLFSGHVDEGLSVVRTILASTGVPFPETRRATIVALLTARLKLKFRGLKFRERSVDQIPTDELLRVDTCRAVALGLSSVDTIRGAVFQTRYLLLALEAGDPHRIAHALAMECGFSSVGGLKTRRRTQHLTGEMRRIATRLGTPYTLANADLVEGIAAALEGHWRLGADLLHRAEQAFLEHCTGVVWELGTARSFGLRCHQFAGDIGIVTRRFPALLHDAQERGDRYFATNIVLFSHYAQLAADDPNKMMQEIEVAITGWSHAGFHVQHVWHLRAGVENALYAGRGMLAWTKVAQSWRAARTSLVMRVQFTRIVLEEMRGRAALAAAMEVGSQNERKSFLAIADRCAKRIEKQRTPWGDVFAQLLRAGTAFLRDKHDECVRRLRTVIADGEREEMFLLVATARRRLGEVTRDAALVDASTQWLAAEGIRNIDAMTRTIAPWERK